jgi:putative redox protein
MRIPPVCLYEEEMGPELPDTIHPAYWNMVSVSIEYTGDLHCNAVHGPSRSKIATDAPTDNKGKGESFSPTDLVATALGTCMSTILAMAAEEHGLNVKGMTVNVSKEMSKDAPRRIIGLPSEVHIPLPGNTPQRALLENAALNCPVHKSLPPEIERPTKFFWEESEQ